MHMSHITEDIRELTLHPIMITVNLLMKTNQKLSIYHHSSLSSSLSRGMSSGFISGSRLRMTNISTKGVRIVLCPWRLKQEYVEALQEAASKFDDWADQADTEDHSWHR